MAENLLILISVIMCLCQLNRVDAEVTFVSSTCVNGANYTKNSIYEKNLNLLFSELSTKTSTHNFYNATSGKIPDKLYALYQCRTDVSAEICNECIIAATNQSVHSCPSAKEAYVWYEECMLRYANRSIFSSAETSPGPRVWSLRNVSNYDALAPVLAAKLDSVISRAAVATPFGHFATEDGNWTLFDSVYCLAQCTPDIDGFHCKNCLTRALSTMINDYNTSIRVMVFYPSCQLRYDTTEQFYHELDAAVPAPAPSEMLVTNPGKTLFFFSL